jgi:RNA ligase
MSKYKPIGITHKEKADQLLESVMFSLNKQFDSNTGKDQPIPRNPYYKECALAIVNEIFEFMEKDDLDSETAYWANHPLSNFWVGVEREIKKQMNLIQILENYFQKGWLIKQTHPTLPLTIWNYSQTTQYEGRWDEITLMCRGLVTDDDGNIVARPFKKFFNLEEGKHTPTSEFEVYEKMDGSLGIFFYYQEQPVFASRGSFTSDQAIKGRTLLDKYNWQGGTYPGYTYLFEILYPENRIVVNYGDLEELVVLGVLNTQTGEECDFSEMKNEGFVLVKKYDGVKDYTKLKSMIFNNQEGFVVKFSNGNRVKIKGEEYLRLHKIMTEVSTKSVWEILSNGDNMEEILRDVPDEFFDKVKEYETELVSKFDDIKNEYTWIYKVLERNEEISENRAIFAQYAKRYKHPSILFGLLDGKNIDPMIWKIIQPEYKKL